MKMKYFHLIIKIVQIIKLKLEPVSRDTEQIGRGRGGFYLIFV